MSLRKKRIGLNTKPKGPWDMDSFERFEVDPNLYTHLTMIAAIDAVPKGIESGKIENGFMALDCAVNQLEQILKARAMIPDDDDPANAEFEEKVKAEKKRLEGEGITETLLLSARLANFRMKRLYKMAFNVKGKSIEGQM